MRRGMAVLVLLVGCTTPSPAPMLGEMPKIDDVSVVPAVESPDDAVRDTTAIDAPATTPETPSAQPLDPAIDVAIAKLGGPVCPSPASACPASCMAIGGMKFDDANQCYAPLILGCMKGTAINSDLTCSVRSDGVVFIGSGSQLHRLGDGWGARSCTPEEWGNDGTERRMCTKQP